MTIKQALSDSLKAHPLYHPNAIAQSLVVGMIEGNLDFAVIYEVLQVATELTKQYQRQARPCEQQTAFITELTEEEMNAAIDEGSVVFYGKPIFCGKVALESHNGFNKRYATQRYLCEKHLAEVRKLGTDNGWTEATAEDVAANKRDSALQLEHGNEIEDEYGNAL